MVGGAELMCVGEGGGGGGVEGGMSALQVGHFAC